MGRKNSPSVSKELNELIAKYEAAKAEDRQLYLDGDQFADIADYYATERKFNEAQEVINYGLQLHPGNTDLLVEQAYLYLDTQKIHKAKATADSITEDFDTEVKMLKAELLLNEGKLEEAQILLDTIEEADELETIVNIVYLYLDMGYPEAAKEWLDRGKSQYSESEDFIVITADYLATTSQFKEAIVNYNQLIDMDPYNSSYWMGLAKCCFAEEDIDKTVEACDFALAADENCGEAYAYKAHSFFYLNNVDGALENYRKAIEHKAIPPEMGYMFMGMSYANKEEWEKADECYEEVIRLFEKEGNGKSPLLLDTYTSKAYAMAKSGKTKEAHQLCDKARKLELDESCIYHTEGKIYLIENKLKEASKVFKKAAKADSSIDMLYLIGNAYSDAEFLYESMLYYEKVYEINPKYEDVTEKMSILSLMYNKIDDFFKYNKECQKPFNEDTILELLSQPNNSEEGEKVLKEIWERMKREKGNK